MAFTTGTATSLANFISSVAIYAAANAGYTNNGTSTVNTTSTAQTISKGGVFWIFVTDPAFFDSGDRYMGCRMTYAAPSGTYNNTTPVGQPNETRLTIYNSPETFSAPYFIFTNGDAVHCVLEIFSDIFVHLSFGNMATKFGTWTGGEYVTATYVRNNVSNINASAQCIAFNENLENLGNGPGYVRNALGANDEDDFAPMSNIENPVAGGGEQQALMIAHVDNYIITGSSATVGFGVYGRLFRVSPNQANLRSALIPCYVRLKDTAVGSNLFRFAGIIDGVRLVNIRDLNPKEIVENYQVFPVTQKTGNNSTAPGSNYLGMAYLRTA